MTDEHIRIERLLSDGELVVPDLPETEDEATPNAAFGVRFRRSWILYRTNHLSELTTYLLTMQHLDGPMPRLR